MERKATISFGLPVYNGERHVSQAIDSVLAQNVDDFELIIADNASTDDTWAICQEYAQKDDRIRLFRHDTNIGAAPNFNFVFEKSSGQFFKWVAADDIFAPDFVEVCLTALNQDPDVSLATTKARIIDEDGNWLEDYDYDASNMSDGIAQRFRKQIRGHQCYEVFGVFRRSELAIAMPMGSYFAGDAVLLMRMIVHGKIHESERRLFVSRRHPEQSERLRNAPAAYMVWFNPANAGSEGLPYWNVLREYFLITQRNNLCLVDRVACRFAVVKWTVARRRFILRDAYRFLINRIANRPSPVSDATQQSS